jgi:predicted alpha/beta-fold hydrolase
MKEFQPRWPWSHRHFQSILPSILPRHRLDLRARQLLAVTEELILDCGDGVRLQAFRAQPAIPNGMSAILLHGWEGSANAYYVLSLATCLHAAGVEVVRLNLRDHGATHHLNEGIFHSCRLAEVCGAVAALGPKLRATPWLVGFSLGGNFWLRVAASGDPRLPQLAGVVAVSPVLHPDSAMHAMEEGWQVYQNYFLRKWSASLRIKQALWPDLPIGEEIFHAATLREMTRLLVAHHTSFPNVEAYLNGYAITGGRLETLAVPATILSALDDPIIPPADLTRLARSPRLKLLTLPHGGHMGFMESPWAGSWINQFVASELGLTPR